jgi:hypothetical protein
MSETTTKQKITSLTKEQEAQMPVYVDKWLSIGSNTDRLDRARATKTVNSLRKIINMKEAPVLFAENPIEAWVMCCLLEQGVSNEDLNAEMVAVFNGNPKKREIPRASLPWLTGSFFASIFSFYDYMIEVAGVEIEPELWAKYKVWEATSELGCIYPLSEYTIVTEKPSVIHFNENKVLHRDGGPALSYSGLGDFNIYILNGVEVPEWLATTPAQHIEIAKYNDISNADVKAEFVRKLGIERFLDKGVIIDTHTNYSGNEYEWWHKSKYELIDMNCLFTTLEYAPYIKMVNQTTGIYHVEAVSPACRTLQDALRERFGGRDFVIKAIA